MCCGRYPTKCTRAMLEQQASLLPVTLDINFMAGAEKVPPSQTYILIYITSPKVKKNKIHHILN
jgi:hypothetical protein